MYFDVVMFDLWLCDICCADLGGLIVLFGCDLCWFDYVWDWLNILLD